MIVARVAAPSRPEISPVSDTSVLVRWTVPPPSGSLAVVTFKLQYRDVLERTAMPGWQTVDDDIPASHRAFEVTRLRPGTFLRTHLEPNLQNILRLRSYDLSYDCLKFIIKLS